MTEINRRISVSQFGGPEQLVLVEESIPEPKRGEVLIQNLFAGVSIGDVITRKGGVPFNRPPVTPGTDTVGIIKKVGPGVSSMKVGQLVASLPFSGGYSEHMCTKERNVVPVPDGVAADDAASVVLNYLMAYQLLHRVAKVTRGEVVLIHGASGGIGTALLQLGRIANLTMLGTASKKKHDYVSSFGATPIDYKNADFLRQVRRTHPDGVDVVFDCMGGTNFNRSYQLLRSKGRLIGYSSQNFMSTMMSVLRRKFVPDGKKATNFLLMLSVQRKRRWFKEDLTNLFLMVRSGSLQPVIKQCFPLADARAAHALQESGTVTGKILLRMTPDKGTNN